MHKMLPRLIQTDFPPIHRGKVETLQANLGYRCNQTCVHCHVAAGPRRTEEMSWETMEQLLSYARKHQVSMMDLTGGAPEMNPHFKRLVTEAVKQGIKVMDRCNLTILSEPGYEDVADFLSDHQVEVVASLPCYLEENVDAQRGNGVFQRSIEGLQKLNSLGYGIEGTGKTINLVYNPQGPVLPPNQQGLEQAYKDILNQEFGISFNNLFTLANMPIKRFGSMLVSKGTFDEYMTLLRHSYNADNLNNVMCRSIVSVDWQGYVYDCDFNQQLHLNLGQAESEVHIGDLLDYELEGDAIHIADHCYGCTAGQGSSCGGALE